MKTTGHPANLGFGDFPVPWSVMSSTSFARFVAALLFSVMLPDAATAADTAVRIIRTEEPRFPESLLLTEALKEGEASVLAEIDAEGHLADALVVRDTHREFGREALATVQRWRFEPARRDGRPIRARTEIRFHFAADRAVVGLNASSTVRELAAFTGSQLRFYERLCRAADLDRPPQPVKSVSPRRIAPTAGAPAVVARPTVIDFIIDETGRPRMPVLVSAPDDAHALSAADALLQWQFAPPTRRGEPTAVRVRQEFRFPGDS